MLLYLDLDEKVIKGLLYLNLEMSATKELLYLDLDKKVIKGLLYLETGAVGDLRASLP